VTTDSGFGITDEALGTLVRGHYILSDGERLDDDYYSLTCNLDGRAVGFIAHSLEPEAPSRGEVIDALRDLVLESVEVFPDNCDPRLGLSADVPRHR
jgi:hypothetical protein